MEIGKKVALGQSMEFIYTLGKPGVCAYGANEFNEKTLDVAEYSKLLQRAAMTILEPFARLLKCLKANAQSNSQSINPTE